MKFVFVVLLSMSMDFAPLGDHSRLLENNMRLEIMPTNQNASEREKRLEKLLERAGQNRLNEAKQREQKKEFFDDFFDRLENKYRHFLKKKKSGPGT